ncbi:hypothetical protein AGMMS49975_25280 [Clostridia bacterium]|nr:hypothetical protein AGMMS49975_25280 [Clostridia bacterium]
MSTKGRTKEEIVSYVMSRNRSTNTKPEIIVRGYLHSRGLRFRKNDRRYPGQPDIVLPKYRTIVFVHGCFWHKHESFPYFSPPKTRVEFWENKFTKNQRRDAENIKKLEAVGWHVIIVWECELRKSVRDKRLMRLYDEITNKTLLAGKRD